MTINALSQAATVALQYASPAIQASAQVANYVKTVFATYLTLEQVASFVATPLGTTLVTVSALVAVVGIVVLLRRVIQTRQPEAKTPTPEKSCVREGKNCRIEIVSS